MDSEKEESPPEVVEERVSPPRITAPADARTSKFFVLGDLVLRFLLFASSLVAVLVMVTSTQDHWVQFPFPPFIQTNQAAKFTHSPAFIYFVASFSVAGFYSIITTVLSFLSLLKPDSRPYVSLCLVIFDVLLLGIVASATGAAGGVAYIWLNGNTHTRWNKICYVFDEFCKHVVVSIAFALFGSGVLIFLILLSVYSISKRIPK